MRTHLDIIVGKIIALERKSKGLTQAGAARAMGVSSSMASRIERGSVPLTIVRLHMLCRETHSSVVDVIGRIEMVVEQLGARRIQVETSRTTERAMDTVNPNSIRDFVKNCIAGA